MKAAEKKVELEAVRWKIAGWLWKTSLRRCDLGKDRLEEEHVSIVGHCGDLDVRVGPESS